MKTDFKVYPRKIHVWMRQDNALVYAWSSNAYRTCREAVQAAKALRPDAEFVANFAKD